MSSWTVHVTGLTGATVSVKVTSPESSTVLDLKKLISAQYVELPHYLQRLVFWTGMERKKLEDTSKLIEVGLRDNATVSLIALNPFELYVQDMNGKQHVVVVPSCEPEMYDITSLTNLVQAQLQQSLDEYCFQYNGRPVESVRHGRKMTLREWSIKNKSLLVLTKVGFSLIITNPQVDVCFLVDCTGSMQGHIEAVKNSVTELRDNLVKEYKTCDLKFSFVRYTDYDQPSSTRTTLLDFTQSPTVFRSFVSAITAAGGGDAPEDIMGALKITFSKLSWRNECTKVLIHVADAPCHGTQYHTLNDTYPDGDPAGISHEEMMAEVVKLEVQYWFGYIQRPTTDQMIQIFNKSLSQLSEQRLLIRQFDAIQPNEVSEAVHRSVNDSVLATTTAKRTLPAVRKVTMDTSIPNWSSCAIIEKYGMKTPPAMAKSLSDLQKTGELLEAPSVAVCFKIAPSPFGQGAESHVYHGYDVYNKRAIVLKQHKFVAPEYNSLDCYMKKLEVQTTASAYAREFNQEKTKGSTTEITFSHLDVVESTDDIHYLWEPFLNGKFIKFSNNFGVVRCNSPNNEILQAFSHYTWMKSGGHIIVCDLEGIVDGNRLVLTDPAIHSRGPAGNYGRTDAGYNGIQRFFSTHICQETCTKMGLQSYKL